MDIFGFYYSEIKLKSHLMMAIARLQIHGNKKITQAKLQKREIAKLLANDNDEKASIKAEHVIREDFLVEGLQLLELLCELLQERIKYLSSSKTCPDDLLQSVCTVIWAANKVDIEELLVVKAQLIKKFGKDIVKQSEVPANINERVMSKLSVQPPTNALVIRYLEEIASDNNIDWVHSGIGLPANVNDPMPSPAGFSVCNRLIFTILFDMYAY